MTLGCSAFDPLPGSSTTIRGLRKEPIGNGPFQADTDWVPGHGMTLTRYDNYAGKNKAKSRGVVMRMYTELSTGYTDVLAGNLDILQNLPPTPTPAQRTSSRAAIWSRPHRISPAWASPLRSALRRRARATALSMAIDRKAIVDAIFLGTRVAADSFAPPTVVGYRANACGKWCEYHPDEAKKLLAEANFDSSQPVEIWFNAGAGHDGWMTAVANMFRKIGLSYKLRGNLQFNEFLSNATQRR